MALFKVDFVAEGGRMQSAFVVDAADLMVEEMIRTAFGAAFPGVGVSNATRLPDEKWFPTDIDGIMITQEEGDVEYSEPILSNADFTVYGSESAESLLEDAGVSEGYKQVAAEEAVAAYAVGLDKFAAEEMGVPFYPGDEVIIRRALLSSIERLRYVARKAHDANAEQALHRQIEEIGQTLIRWDVEHPGAKLAI